MLLTKYRDEIVPTWIEEKGNEYKNVFQVPRLEKIVLNVGFGGAKDVKKEVEQVQKELALIAGQKPVVRKAKRSIAGFELREGTPVGASVVLRRQRMYQFLEKLVFVVLPRVKDFRGLAMTGFDGQGNYSIGFDEQSLFPEIDQSQVARRRGLQITIVTSARIDAEAAELLIKLGLPLVK